MKVKMKSKKLIAVLMSVCMLASLLCFNFSTVSAAEVAVPASSNVIKDSGFDGSLTNVAGNNYSRPQKTEEGVWYWQTQKETDSNASSEYQTGYKAKFDVDPTNEDNKVLYLQAGAPRRDAVYQVLPESATSTGRYTVKFKAKAATGDSASIIAGLNFINDEFIRGSRCSSLITSVEGLIDCKTVISLTGDWKEYEYKFDVWGATDYLGYSHNNWKNLYVLFRNISKQGQDAYSTTEDVLIDDVQVIPPDCLQVSDVSSNTLNPFGGEIDLTFNYEGIYEELITSDNISVTYADGSEIEGVTIENILSENQYVESFDETTGGSPTFAYKVKGIQIKYPMLDEAKGSVKIEIKNLISRTPKADNQGNLTNAYNANMTIYKTVEWNTNKIYGYYIDAKDSSFVRMNGTQTITLPVGFATSQNAIVDSGFEGTLNVVDGTAYAWKARPCETDVGKWYWQAADGYLTKGSENYQLGYKAKFAVPEGETDKVLYLQAGATNKHALYQVLSYENTATGVYKVKFKAKPAAGSSACLYLQMGYAIDSNSSDEFTRTTRGLGSAYTASTANKDKRKNDFTTPITIDSADWKEYTAEYFVYSNAFEKYDTATVKNLYISLRNISNNSAENGGITTADVMIDDFEVIAPDNLYINSVSQTELNPFGGKLDVNFNYEGIYEELITLDNISVTYADGSSVEGVTIENILSDNQYATAYEKSTQNNVTGFYATSFTNKVKGIRISYSALDTSKGQVNVKVKNLVSRTQKPNVSGDLTFEFNNTNIEVYKPTYEIGLKMDTQSVDFVRMAGEQTIVLNIKDTLVTLSEGSSSDKLKVTIAEFDKDYVGIVAFYSKDENNNFKFEGSKVYDYTVGDAETTEEIAKLDGASFVKVFAWSDLGDSLIPYNYAYDYALN